MASSLNAEAEDVPAGSKLKSFETLNALATANGIWAEAKTKPTIIGNQLPFMHAKTMRRNPADKMTASPMILFKGLPVRGLVEFIQRDGYEAMDWPRVGRKVVGARPVSTSEKYRGTFATRRGWPLNLRLQDKAIALAYNGFQCSQ